MRLIDVKNIEDIAMGAAVLGAGGGGDPYIGKLMAIRAIQEYGPVELYEPDEIPDDCMVVPAAMMGAPTVLIEKFPKGDESMKVFQALESYLGRKIDYTLSIEAGGLNSTIPFALAARLRMPVLDCDEMGRAFPEIQMVMATLSGISAAPFVMADEKGNSVIINAVDNKWTETFARSITVNMGAAAVIAAYVMTGKQLKQSAVPGTISLAESIGRTIREARAGHRDIAQAVQKVTGGYEIFRGKIMDIQRKTVAGFARGEAILDGMEPYSGKKMTIQFQNEHLVAIRDGEIVVSVPDLIAILDAETGEPITTEAIRYGFRTVVLGIPCYEKWRSPEGLKLVGPRYFGYDIDYIPIEKRFK